jgi:tetratricopeptide (TPR) repeat protein
MEKVTDANVHFICGVVYMALKQEAKAIDYYEKALYLDASHEEVMMHLIVAYRDSGREYKAGMLERRLNRLK